MPEIPRRRSGILAPGRQRNSHWGAVDGGEGRSQVPDQADAAAPFLVSAFSQEAVVDCSSTGFVSGDR